jgi:hypothetical protein
LYSSFCLAEGFSWSVYSSTKREMFQENTSSPASAAILSRTPPGIRVAREKWFEYLFGFSEQEADGNPTFIHERLHIDGNRMTSRVNGASYICGEFSCPSLGSLRARFAALKDVVCRCEQLGDIIEVQHIATKDIFELHAQEDFANATFMAASQFNCLEFPSQNVTPEDGVTDYIYDGTQGPACALAAPAATVARNYFVNIADDRVGGSISSHGQTASNQIENLADMLAAVGGEDLVDVVNGYTLSESARLGKLNAKIDRYLHSNSRDELLSTLRIGHHAGVEIPWFPRRFDLRPPEERPAQIVTQTFCSAVSCSYSQGSDDKWAPIAQLVLDASYEATLLAAAIEAAEGRGSGQVLLTFLGGGAFGNRDEWIESAIVRACVKLGGVGLRVVLCHHGRVDPRIVERIALGIETERAR